jgi:hypothetical protein
MAEANFQTADLSVRGVQISDLITGRIFTASLDTAPECADGRRGRSRLLPTTIGNQVVFAEIPGYHQAADLPAIAVRLILHIDILSHKSVPAIPSIGHPDDPIHAHLTAKHRHIVALGHLSNTGTSCDPGRERLMPNLVRSIRSPTQSHEHSMAVVEGASSVGKSSIVCVRMAGAFELFVHNPIVGRGPRPRSTSYGSTKSKL